MQVLTIDEAAKRASVVRRTMDRYLAEGTGPATIQLGKRRKGILDTDLERWILSRRKAAPGTSSDDLVDLPRLNGAALAHMSFILRRILPKRGEEFEINRYNGRWRHPATGACGRDVVSLIAYARGGSLDEAARLIAEALGLHEGGAANA